MKNNTRYWGSVQFYKHLILTVVALMILVPSIGLLIMLVRHYKLKESYHMVISEQLLYIDQLELRLADFTEYWANTDTDIILRTKESQLAPETPDLLNIPDEDMLSIPFSVDLNDWKYILVNDRHPLPISFQPELTDMEDGKQVHKNIKIALERMIRDAEKEGFDLIVCSAYRDYETQENLVKKSMEKLMRNGYHYTEAHWLTKQQIALVGTSEHHTGLAVDIVGINHQMLDEKQADTAEAKWLEEHACEYGFILRYPKNKEDITGIFYESWHFRYVGTPAATFMKEHQLCLEEFLELAEKQ